MSNEPAEYEVGGRRFSIDEYPDYVGDEPPDATRIRDIDYRDEVESIWGREWGAQGIGRLTEVALVEPTEHEGHPLFTDHNEYFMMTYGDPDVEGLKRQHRAYADILESEGVTVRYMEYDDVWGAYGPHRKLFVAATLGTVLRNGVILRRYGQNAYIRGMNRYAQRFFTDIGCPISLQVTGTGILEPAWPWVAEGVTVGSFGRACNWEGLRQAVPVFEAAGLEEVVMGSSTATLGSMQTSGAFHMDTVLNAVDAGLALVYPPQLDHGVYEWLVDHGFDLIPVPRDEHREYMPCNGMTIEPGKVVMAEAATETNRALREAGVEVIELDTSQIRTGGVNGIRCITCRLHREPGPTLDEVAESVPDDKPDGLVNVVSAPHHPGTAGGPSR